MPESHCSKRQLITRGRLMSFSRNTPAMQLKNWQFSTTQSSLRKSTPSDQTLATKCSKRMPRTVTFGRLTNRPRHWEPKRTFMSAGDLPSDRKIHAIRPDVGDEMFETNATDRDVRSVDEQAAPLGAKAHFHVRRRLAFRSENPRHQTRRWRRNVRNECHGP